MTFLTPERKEWNQDIVMRQLFIVCGLLLTSALAHADDLGCFVPGSTVAGGFVQLPDTATSVTAKVTDKDDAMSSPYATPIMTDRGENMWTAADFTAGSTLGTHKIRYSSMVHGMTLYAADTFVVAAKCSLTPTVSRRTLDVEVSGEAGLDLSNVNDTIDAPRIRADAITDAKVADAPQARLDLDRVLTLDSATVTSVTSTASLTETAAETFIGYVVECAKNSRKVEHYDGATKTLYTESGRPYPAVPSGECLLLKGSLR